MCREVRTSPAGIGIVSFDEGLANLNYWWHGQGGAQVQVTGSPGTQEVTVTAGFYSAVDAACCPVRDYRFVLAEGGSGTIEVTSDNRPWLGIYGTGSLYNTSSPVRVVGIAPGSPAESVLQTGDLIRTIADEVLDADTLGVVESLAEHHPGDTVVLELERAGELVEVTVRLGSLLDRSAFDAGPVERYRDYLF